MNNDVVKTGMNNMVDTESTLLADMYASHLVSQIENSGDRISLTFTAQGHWHLQRHSSLWQTRGKGR